MSNSGHFAATVADAGADPGRGTPGQRRAATMGEGTAESGGQTVAGRSTDRPVAALSPFGREGDHANQGTRVGWKLPRARQSVESVRAAHRSDSQRESAQAQRVW